MLFARIARGCFYEHGDEVHKVYFSKGGPGPFQLATFNPLEVKYFPIICDFAVQCYIPVTYGEGKDFNTSLMELMLFDFCNWLYLRKLTPIRTSFAKDFKLDYKPPPSKNRHAKQDHKEAYFLLYSATITKKRRRIRRRKAARWRRWRRKEQRERWKAKGVKNGCRSDMSVCLR